MKSENNEVQSKMNKQKKIKRPTRKIEPSDASELLEAEINPDKLDLEVYVPDIAGRELSKGHQPYEFKRDVVSPRNDLFLDSYFQF